MPGLEEMLAENTAALRENTAAILKGGEAAPATQARGPGRPKKVDFDTVKAIAKRLMDEKGRPVAVALIQKHGADQLANLAEAQYPAFVAAAEVLLSAAAAPEPAPAATDDL